MNYYLIKSEPNEYSINDLQSDGTTEWDGVRNYQAVSYIKEWTPGDRLYIYHSGKERTIVGLAHVESESYPDPNDDRSWIAKITFDAILNADTQISLKTIKAQDNLQDFALVRQPRLSVMPCPDTFVTWMQEQGIIWPSE
ncbi:MAG: EVE domain-containing protein [Candidatus Paceibacteria bacterium]